uniref:Inner dynein arm light chain, axonemal n=1 Tax=Diabrotica virgifera virgifera TaxID=50390 RepID=A0A6P7GVD2_DIAVI
MATERIIPSPNTLVKYDNPVLVSKHEAKPGPSGEDVGRRSTLTADVKRETEEILNTILPPKEWEEEGQMWRQAVSTTPATRLDVVNLQEQLDMRLQQRQARETGICPVRRELYTQCFDEIIRQVTINCAERGLLLLRVRDEMRMTIEAYQALYCSSVAF